MGRKSNVAGLAALAALGYSILKDKKKEAATQAKPSESKKTSEPTKKYDMGEFEGVDEAVAAQKLRREADEADAARNPPRKQAAKANAPRTVKFPASKEADAMDVFTSGPYGGPNVSPSRADLRGRSEEAGMAAYKPRRPVQAAPARSTSPRPSREELISQIPGSSPEGWQGGTGDRVTGNELTRNAVPLAMMMGPGMSIAGNASRITPRIAQVAGEREAVTNPLQWMAGRSGELARKAMSEADTTGGAIGYKKGGSTRKTATAKKAYAKGGPAKTESKPSVKGWGMARGARKAKIY